MHLSPAEYVIHVFGGVRATARALNRTPPTISKWHKQNGHVPTSIQKLILDKASELGLDITPDDLIYGRSLSKQEIMSNGASS